MRIGAAGRRAALVLRAGDITRRPSLVRGAHFAFAVWLPMGGFRIAAEGGEVADLRVTGLELTQPDATIPLPIAQPVPLDSELRLPDLTPLATRHGPAVLVVKVEAIDGAPIEAVGPHLRAIFLSGDSTPKDSYFADFLRPRLLPFFAGTLHTEAELLGVPPQTRIGGSVRVRRARLDSLIAAQDDRRDELILIGRSAGGRVASQHADTCGARGVICLGYPFRHPNTREEPDRYQHLTRMRTPTLIIQGKGDLYGGAEAAWRYARSPQVDMVMIDTRHEFIMAETLWDLVGRRILLFLAHRCGPKGEAAAGA